MAKFRKVSAVEVPTNKLTKMTELKRSGVRVIHALFGYKNNISLKRQTMNGAGFN